MLGIALTVALDCFLVVTGADIWMLGTLLIEPKRWKKMVVVCTLSTTVGCLALYLAVSYFSWGAVLTPDQLAKAKHLFETYGNLTVGLIALGPFPIQPGIIAAGLGKMNVVSLVASVFIGRGLKNIIMCGAVAKMPEKLGL